MFYFQFEIIARDSVPAPLTLERTGTVIITIEFDDPPRFEASNYTVIIDETHAVGSDVTTEIRATDPNPVRMSV